MISTYSHKFHPSQPPKNEQDANVRRSAQHVQNEVDNMANGLKALDNTILDTNPAKDQVSIGYDSPAAINGKFVVGTYSNGNMSAASITSLKYGSLDATYSRSVTDNGADRSITQHAYRYVPDTVEVNDLAAGSKEYKSYINPDAFGQTPIFFP